MYQSYFGLAEAPFSIAPAPRYLYMSQRHQEALAHLLYGVNSGGGFVLLTGEIGAGKTTVCRCLLEQIPDTCDVAYIFNPKLTVDELLSSICVEFGIHHPPGNSSIKVFVDCINTHLLDAHARGRHAVLIIDEAQNLSADVLEQMRLLTNLETSERKLLQIILIGQPELATMLERPELKQLSQRIVARYHLGALSKAEVAAYIRHRLEIAGTQKTLFPASLTRRLYQISGGVPRVINVLCDRALLGAYVQGKDRVDRKTLAQAEREILQTPSTQRRDRQRVYAIALLGLLGVLIGVGLLTGLPWPTSRATAEQAPPLANLPATAPKPVHALATETNSTPPGLSTLNWPASLPVSRSDALAHAALFTAWGARYQAGDPCRQAEAIGLRCRSERGSLVELRQLNLPAVLALRDEQGLAFQATLLGLAAEHASLMIGESRVNVDLGALARHWTGDYRLFWRAPAAVQVTLRPGASGAGVAWVINQLAKLQGQTQADIETPHETPHEPATETALYDDALSTRIKQFQRSRGLNPDGNVGPNTLIHLLGESDASAPRLLINRN
jgi:general secretion pathway protein A